MESVVSHIARKTEAEAIYTRERERSNRARFRAYYADFHAACGRRDYRRIAEVVQDATTITSDTLRLVRRMGEIRTRRRALASHAGFAAKSVSSPTSAQGLRLIDAARGEDSPRHALMFVPSLARKNRVE